MCNVNVIIVVTVVLVVTCSSRVDLGAISLLVVWATVWAQVPLLVAYLLEAVAIAATAILVPG